MKCRDFMVLAGGMALKTGSDLIHPSRVAASSGREHNRD
jgi:hypothetical protein